MPLPSSLTAAPAPAPAPARAHAPRAGRKAARQWALAGALLLASFAAAAGIYEDFFLMVELDRPSEITKLVQRGFDPNSLSTKGESGLYLALRGDSNDAADALIAMPKVDINARNAAGETPLMMAALRKNLPAMRKLIARGALVNQPGWTPLHYAASGGSQEAIELLLSQGAQIDALSPNGSTPLMLAAGYGGEDAAELLRKRGAAVGLRNQRELSAADFAKRAGRDALAARLAAASAKP